MTDVCVTLDATSKEYLKCSNPSTAPFIREFCRSPLQWDATANAGFSNGTKTWLPVAENYRTVNIESQTGLRRSHLDIFKVLMTLRKTDAGVNGTLTIKALTDDILLIKRSLEDTKKESLLAIFNFGSREASLKSINESEFPKEVNKIVLSTLNSFHTAG